MDLVRHADVQITNEDGSKSPLKVGLVQTAYANGSSTAYVKEILVRSIKPVVFFFELQISRKCQ
jgi:hypothetical protein